MKMKVKNYLILKKKLVRSAYQVSERALFYNKEETRDKHSKLMSHLIDAIKDIDEIIETMK